MKVTVVCVCMLLGLASAQSLVAGKKGGGGGGKAAHAGGGGGHAAHAGGGGGGGHGAHMGEAGQHNAHANLHNGNGNVGHHGLNSHNRVAGHGINGKGQAHFAGQHTAHAFHGGTHQFARVNGHRWAATHWRSSHVVFASYHRVWHDSVWWGSHYNVVVVGGGWGPWYWNGGYWFPAWGYDARFVSYGCDCPVYAYANLPPDQVVVNVQEALQDQGYYAGNIDGQLGQQTREALGQYQREHNLEITSAVDEPTVQSLGLTNEQA